MKKVLFFLGVTCLFTVFSSFKAVPPATVIDQHFDVCGPFMDFNPCNGATITTTGCYGIDVHAVINNNRINQSVHYSGHLTATDDQGNSYEVSIHENISANGSLTNGQFEENETVSVEFISKGGAPNFVIKENFHVTVNANGTVTILRGSSSAECRG